jgi:predicted DNA-binding transcriptional regulator AlpA
MKKSKSRSSKNKPSIDYLRSLNDLDLEASLSKLDPEDQADLLSQLVALESEEKQNEKPQILTTAVDLAKYFRVDRSTVDKWLNDPTFPGTSGDRGRKNGSFPVSEIEAWRERRGLGDASGTKPSGLASIAVERHRKLKLENDEREGKLIDLELVTRLMVRSISTAKQLIGQLRIEIPQLLPADTPEVVRVEIGGAIERKLESVFLAMASEFRELKPDHEEALA